MQETGAGRAAERRAGAGGGGTDDAGQGDGESDEDAEFVSLAPGVRGVFEMRWDPPRLRPDGGEVGSVADRVDAPKPGDGSWSLWWRPLTQAEIDVLWEENLSADESLREDYMRRAARTLPDGPLSGAVKLVSDLEWCRWEVVRGGETLSSCTAYAQEELPAFVTLELKTMSGMWMKWMLEVDWTRGPEPGDPVEGSGGSGAQQLPTPTPAGGNNLNGRGGK